VGLPGEIGFFEFPRLLRLNDQPVFVEFSINPMIATEPCDKKMARWIDFAIFVQPGPYSASEYGEQARRLHDWKMTGLKHFRNSLYTTVA
jgi:hypothetical protein